MRKTTQEVVRAFYNGHARSMGNSSTDGVGMYLHGHKIAEKRDGVLWITLAGWPTVTTRERLNGLSGVRVSQRKGEQYLNGKLWDGAWTPVIS